MLKLMPLNDWTFPLFYFFAVRQLIICAEQGQRQISEALATLCNIVRVRTMNQEQAVGKVKDGESADRTAIHRETSCTASSVAKTKHTHWGFHFSHFSNSSSLLSR